MAEDTGFKSAGRRFSKASARAMHTVTDCYDEAPVPSLKRRNAEPVVENGPRKEFTPSRELRLAQALATLTASTVGGDQADLVQPIIHQTTMFGGTGGNGGNGVGRGIGGGGGVGEGPRLNENFFGTQNIILYSEIGGQVNPGISRIGEGLANIRDGVGEVGGQLQSFMNDLLQRLGTQLMACIRRVPRGVSDDLLHVIDPVGGSIAVSLRYCHNYATLDDILKVYLRRLPHAGGRYVERGDYRIVSQDGSFIMPVQFAQTVRAGMLLEISILQRQVQNQRDTIETTTCPSCSCPQATTTGNGWFKCGNTACARNYRIDGQDQDSEGILSPQIAQPNEEAEGKLFRRVHIHIVQMEPTCEQQQQQSSLPPEVQRVDKPPIRLAKGKWPDDFLDALPPPKLLTGKIHSSSPSSVTFGPRKLTIVGATKRNETVESLQQFPRRPSHRARQSRHAHAPTGAGKENPKQNITDHNPS